MTAPDYYAPDTLDETGQWDWQDDGLRSHQRLAARFEQYAEGQLLYVHGTGWHHWDGTRWAPDHRAVHAHDVLSRLLKLSWQEGLNDSELARDVKACNTAHGSAGVLDLASRRMFTEQVDADPYLLNTPTGTLDLHTLKLRDHDPADHITKVTSAAYAPGAHSEDWDRFLASSLPDREVREFLQRYAGLSLIGAVIEHLLVVATGTGRNGKGVVAEMFAAALGDYAVEGVSNDMLIASRYGQQSAQELSARMMLRGARWATMSELEKGDKLAEATMKALTGGDAITAKHMGRDMLSFPPSHSFFMLTNDLPRVDADAQAVWDRMRVIPFNVSFRGREDHGLKDRLRLQLDAVLAWAVHGLADYQDQGLAAPAAVISRTEAYRAENDTFAEFLRDRCVQDVHARAFRTELHQTYADWARENGGESLTPREFTPKVRALDGVSEGKSGGKELWKGIGLKADG